MKRRIWVRVLIGFAVAVAIVAGVVIDMRRKAAAILDQHEAATRVKVEEIRGRSWPRVVMFGDAVHENRWDGLAKALDAFDAIPQAELNELPGFETWAPGSNPDPEKIDAILAKYEPFVDRLRAACRKDFLRPPYAYEQGYYMDLPYLSKAMTACRYLSAASGRAHELGRDREAADHALTALSVAQDMGAGGPVVNRLLEHVGEGHGIRAMRKILEAHSLSAGELQELGATMDRLWASRPRQFESFEIEDAIARLGLVKGLTDPMMSGAQMWGGPKNSWRYLFSGTLLMAEALNQYEMFFAEVEKLDRLRGPEIREAATALERKTRRSRNPIVSEALPTLARAFRREMMTEMNWNLMRTSVALAAYEKEHGAWPAKLEDLVPRYLPRIAPDPTSGKPLRYAPGKLWAFGGDGDDDGGRPIVDEDREDDDGDVVWTVKRK